MAQRKGPGRPSTYKPSKGKKIIWLISQGKTMQEACDEVGVPVGTVYGWLVDDRDSDFTEGFLNARAVSGDPLLDYAREVLFDPEIKPNAKATLINSAMTLYSRLRPNGGRQNAASGGKDGARRGLVLLGDNGRKVG